MEKILKKDARVLFNVEFTESSIAISDLIVVEFKEGDTENWPHHLYKKYDKDFGNCNFTWWEKCSLSHVLLILYSGHGFKDKNTELNALTELAKIIEFEQDIKQFFRGPFDDWEEYGNQKMSNDRKR